jgi:DNA-binding Lrp family transcriptional regulator
VVRGLDSVDIQILRALEKDCRVSYQELGRELGMTANAVKKRMNRLAESGTIHYYAVYLDYAMAHAVSYIALVKTEGKQHEKEILAKIAEDSHVYSVGILSDGGCIIFAQYDRSEASEVFKDLLNSIDGVSEIEIHRELTSEGTIVEFTPLQVRVLRCLLEDARMPVTEIAERTGLTPRRVRRILGQLKEGGGLRFVARVNLNVDPGLTYYAQIIWDEKKVDHDTVMKWLDKEFPGKYYDSHVSGSAPMMLSVFVIDHLRDAETLSRQICRNPAIESVQTLFPFPAKKKPRLQRTRLEQLLSSHV